MLEIFQVIAIRENQCSEAYKRIAEIEVRAVTGKTVWRLSHQQAVLHIKDGVLFYGKLGREIFPIKVKKFGEVEYIHGQLREGKADPLFSLPPIVDREVRE